MPLRRVYCRRIRKPPLTIERRREQLPKAAGRSHDRAPSAHLRVLFPRCRSLPRRRGPKPYRSPARRFAATVKASTLPLPRRVRAPAREMGAKIKGPGQRTRSSAGLSRSADPVCEKRPDPHGCPGRGHRGKHQGVGLDEPGAGGRGRWPDRGPRQGARRPAARHRRDPGDGGRRLERGSEARPCPGRQPAHRAPSLYQGTPTTPTGARKQPPRAAGRAGGGRRMGEASMGSPTRSARPRPR